MISTSGHVGTRRERKEIRASFGVFSLHLREVGLHGCDLLVVNRVFYVGESAPEGATAPGHPCSDLSRPRSAPNRNATR